MRKRMELLAPESCLNQSNEEEMVFVLCARDKAAPETVRDWCTRRVEMELNKWSDPKIVEAMGCATAMEKQQQDMEARHVARKLSNG